MIAAPPLSAGALHESVASFPPPIAEIPVGAPGSVRGAVVAEAAEVSISRVVPLSSRSEVTVKV